MELSEALDSFYGTEVPERLYLYANGGGDRRVTHLQVQNALIAVLSTMTLMVLLQLGQLRTIKGLNEVL